MPSQASYEEQVAQAVATHRSWLFVVTVGLFVAIGLGTWGILDASSASDRSASQAHHAVTKAVQAGELVQAIGRARQFTILHTCQQQNIRHKATVAELKRLLAQAAKKAAPRERPRIRGSQRFTILLIDQLAPLQSCKRLVRSEAAPPEGP